MATTGTPSPLAALLSIPASAAYDVGEEAVLVAAARTGIDPLGPLPSGGGEAVRLTDLPEPLHGRFVPGTSSVLVTMDHGGDERHPLYRLDAPLGELRPVVVEHERIHLLGGF